MIGLEMKYMFRINMLNAHIADPKLFDFIWVNKYRKSLRKRLERLESDFTHGFVSDKAYVIWKQMIKEVL